MLGGGPARRVAPEKLGLAREHRELARQAEASWRAFLKAPRPRLTAAARIAVLLAAVALALGLELTADGKLVEQVGRGGFPTVHFRVWAGSSHLWQDILTVCDTARTQGGDCAALLQRNAASIAYGNTWIAPHVGPVRLYSSVSQILPSLPLDLIQGLTMGAVDGVPSLGVVFHYSPEDPQGAAWLARHEPLPLVEAALAAAVLVNAGVRPLLFAYGDDGEGHCLSSYLGGMAGKERLGLPASCFDSACNLTDFQNESRGRRDCFLAACRNAELERLGWPSGAGFGGCWGSHADSPFFGGAAASVVAYLLFATALSAMAAALTLVLVRARLHCYLDMVAVHQLPAMWPGLRQLAEEQRRPVASVVRSHTSIFMCLECCVAGDAAALRRRFTHLADGCEGAVTHACFVVGVAAPLHVFARFSGGAYRWVTAAVLIGHYAAQLLHAVGYYLRLLPIHWRHGVVPRLYIIVTRLFFFFSLFLACEMLLWTLSAIYFNEAYVLSVLTCVGSFAYFLFHATSIIGKYAKKVQERVQRANAEVQHVLARVDGMAVTAMAANAEVEAAARRRGPKAGEPERAAEAEGGAEAAAEEVAVADAGCAGEGPLLKDGGVLDEQLDEAEDVVDALAWAVPTYARELARIGITGRHLYATLFATGALILLACVFVLLGGLLWRGESSQGYSPMNLLVPCIVYFSGKKAEGQLEDDDESADEEEAEEKAASCQATAAA